jgi:hypothetical protein
MHEMTVVSLQQQQMGGGGPAMGSTSVMGGIHPDLAAHLGQSDHDQYYDHEMQMQQMQMAQMHQFQGASQWDKGHFEYDDDSGGESGGAGSGDGNLGCGGFAGGTEEHATGVHWQRVGQCVSSGSGLFGISQ